MILSSLCSAVSWSNRRSYATLKDIQLRLKAVKNIGKITKSMKMIASTKLNRAQKTMDVGRFYGQTSQSVLKHLEVIPKESGVDYVNGEGDNLAKLREQSKGRLLVLACSSDRGLCGAIHSSVSKIARALCAQDRLGTSVVVLGDKAKPQICRDSRKNIIMHYSQVGKNIPTFLDALAIWNGVAANKDISYDRVAIIYNRFVSAIGFDTVVAMTSGAPDLLALGASLARYEVGEETLGNLADYLRVTRLYWALVEGHAAELSSKRTAMENATKNSEAMVLSLTMKYNRTRQAVITNELCDIITGASAL